jgi:Cro/C1-type HTH DNA-binding domain
MVYNLYIHIRKSYIERVKGMIKFYLEDYLKEKKISLYWLSEMTGIRYATLRAMMKQDHRSLNMVYLDRIMDSLNIKEINILLKKEGGNKDETQH